LIVGGKDSFQARRKAFQREASTADEVLQPSDGSEPVAIIDRLGWKGNQLIVRHCGHVPEQLARR
jgi:hypothetical protein